MAAAVTHLMFESVPQAAVLIADIGFVNVAAAGAANAMLLRASDAPAARVEGFFPAIMWPTAVPVFARPGGIGVPLVDPAPKMGDTVLR
ncbi:MAG: hypothetical protein LT103_07700 [Burkholderiaceae bacterium]|nr:hypothetical protein [Burkholderiaceae bacterium]